MVIICAPKMKKKWVRLLLVFLITVIFLYFFFRKVEWKEVLSYLVEVNTPFFILAVTLTPIHFLTRAFRWKYLLIHEKSNVSFCNMFAASVLGFTVTFLFPGMVGGFHYFSKLALTSLFGIDTNLAVGMTVAVHATQYLVTCLMGYAILCKESISLFQLRKLGEEARK